MANISGSNLEFVNSSGVFQDTSHQITSGYSYANANGYNVQDFTSIPATAQKIYLNIPTTNYTSGPNYPYIQVRDNLGTLGLVNYYNIYQSGSTYAAYVNYPSSGDSTATNMFLAGSYYGMYDLSLEIWKVHSPNQFLYRMYANGGSSSVTGTLTGYGRISNISRISQITFGTGNSNTFTDIYASLTWE